MTITYYTRGSAPPIADPGDKPTLAALCQQLTDRPQWKADQPLTVSADVFAKAEKEMWELRRTQGWGEIARAPLPERNFLLYRTPVICAPEPDVQHRAKRGVR
jgi:hypothetical protein